MVARNEITGARLISRPVSPCIVEAWDAIFAKNKYSKQVTFSSVAPYSIIKIDGIEHKKLDNTTYYDFSTGENVSIDPNQEVEIEVCNYG